MKTHYQQCTRCILDTHDDPNMVFDAQGVCNYCHQYDEMERTGVFKGEEGKRKLDELVAKIKEAGKGKEYDAITGISGGVDSTYLVLKAKELGLRLLVVHFDNGWNSELAVKNIENIVNKLGFDLYTYVVNWDEFKDLQLAYLKASVVDIEIPTDYAIFTTLYKLAIKYNIKYVLNGNNIVTEAILPKHWIYHKGDYVNVKAIHKAYGTVPLKTYPLLEMAQKKYYLEVKGIQSVTPLNYMEYNKKEVKETIKNELGWRDYGGKHYESIFTKFYQGYILPTKFGIDKRKAHLSNLICSKQMKREEALEELKKTLYDPEELKADKEYVLKKLGLSEAEFEAIMKLPPRKHTDFAVEGSIYDHYPILKPLKPIGDIVKKFVSKS
jgi:N-acetyl sugar amidotransferase